MALLAPSPAIAMAPWILPLRRWQAQACQAWVATRPQDDLWIATPGSGKTLAAARLAHALLRANDVARVVYVVPREHLKGQTARAFGAAGVHLDYRFRNSDPHLASDLHGAVVSYQQVAADPRIYAEFTGSVRTLVIFDEIHHAGDQASWGAALRTAFTPAHYRLALSGTPFRSDGQPLPFVHYRGDTCVAGYTYGYKEALVDAICRPVVFGLFDGQAAWISRDGTEHRAKFADRLRKTLHAERLRTHLFSDSLGTVIAAANRRLMHLRRTEHPAAAALAVCLSVEHATTVAGLIREHTRTEPIVVVSEDDEASRNLAAFGSSTAPWIVAVHMVSEGIDIPRLRVGVYASNVRTNLYFRQFAGRFVRIERDLKKTQAAYVYVPADPTIMAFAKQIKDEVHGALKQRRENALEAERVEPSVEPSEPSAYQPLYATLAITGSLHGDLPDVPATSESRQAHIPTSTRVLVDEKYVLKKEVLALVARASRQFEVGHAKIHATLKTRCTGGLRTATFSQLQARKEALTKWIQGNTYDGYR